MNARIASAGWAMLVVLGCYRPGLVRDVPAGDDDDDAVPTATTTPTPPPPQATRIAIDIPYAPTVDETEVPVLVILNPSRVDYAAMASDGSDIRFVDPATDTLLPHEIEHWNPTGASTLWVRVPTVASTGDSRFWLEHGPHGRPAPPPATAVWSKSYLSVLHLNEVVTDESTAGVHADSTGLGNTGLQRRNASVTAPDGRILQDLDGANDHIILDGAGFGGLTTSITLYARIFRNTNTNSFPHVFGADDGADARIWQLFYWDLNNNGCFTNWTARFSIEGSSVDVCPAGTPTGEWNDLVMRYNGAQLAFFIDGILQDTTNATGNVDPFTLLYVGDNPGLGAREFAGFLDEVRISNAVRSNDWIELQSLLAEDQLLVFTPL